MAVSRPAWMHSWRNTEFSTWRAAGLRPNEMLDSPRVVWILGWDWVSRRMASMVSMPSLRTSSCPVEIGNVRQSMMMSSSATPQLPVRSAMIRSAISTLRSAVRACPSSSIVRPTTAAPWRETRRMIRWKRDSGPSPSS